MTRPIVFLDVDGVLNRLVDNPPAGTHVHYVRSLRSASGKYTPVEYTDRDTYRATRRARRNAQRFGNYDAPLGTVFRLVFDDALPQRLAAIGEVAYLVWATTWEHYANEFISPLVGLPTNLPVVEFGDARSSSHAPLFWKTHTVTKWAAGRRFVWLDDDVTKRDRNWVDAQCGEGHSRPLHIGSGAGLRDSDVEFVRSFLG